MCFPTLIKFNKFEPVPCVHKNRAKQTHPILSSLELLQQIQENRIEFQKNRNHWPLQCSSCRWATGTRQYRTSLARGVFPMRPYVYQLQPNNLHIGNFDTFSMFRIHTNANKTYVSATTTGQISQLGEFLLQIPCRKNSQASTAGWWLIVLTHVILFTFHPKDIISFKVAHGMDDENQYAECCHILTAQSPSPEVSFVCIFASFCP